MDGLGHTRLLLDSSGNITDRYGYDAWGNPIEQAGTAFNPFRWNGAAGYEWTPATGLYHVGAREYDPRTARWLQRDPIDAASGDPNLYRYCLNDPVNLADPSGLDLWQDLKQWYMSGMGGLSQWVDQNLMFGLTERFGTTAGLYDCGQASGWQLAGDATLWGGALLLAGFSAVVPGDEVVASQGVRASTTLSPRLVFSKHALERLSERGITPAMVRKAIERGKQFWDPKTKTINHVLEHGMASGKHLVVGRNPVTGEVSTAFVTRRLTKRYQSTQCR
ncbi:MAG: hypothetical protein KatS3mg022_2040 [Armatimonadota bacterium]|nr:MAG: hypothetical protein KatS3mg022_2040 [Armatimonadota bacterium]